MKIFRNFQKQTKFLWTEPLKMPQHSSCNYSVSTSYQRIFLPIKSSETYYSLFEILKRKMAALNLVFNPDTFMLDYESSILKNCLTPFPNQYHQRLHFHFSQAVWRRVQNFGLANQYAEPQVGWIIISLMALPFVPRMFVRQQYNNIKASNNTGIQAVTREFQNHLDRCTI